MRRAYLSSCRLLSRDLGLSTSCLGGNFEASRKEQLHKLARVWTQGCQLGSFAAASTASQPVVQASAGSGLEPIQQGYKFDRGAKLLLKQINNSRWWPELAALVQSYGPEFHLKHCQASLKQLQYWRLQAVPAQRQQLEQSGLLNQLEGLLVPLVYRLGPSEVLRSVRDAAFWPHSPAIAYALAARAEAVAGKLNAPMLTATLRNLTILGAPVSQRLLQLLPPEAQARLQLETLIYRCTSYWQLAHLTRTEGGRFVACHVRVVVSRAAHLAGFPLQDRTEVAARRDMFAALKPPFQANMASFELADLASMLHKMYKLEGETSRWLIAALFARVGETAHEFGSRALADALAGMDLLRHKPRQQLLEALAVQASRINKDHRSWDLRRIVTALSSMRVATSSETWNRLAFEAAGVSGMSMATITDMLVRLGSLRRDGRCQATPGVLLRWAQRICSCAPYLRGGEFAHCMWALKSMGYRPSAVQREAFAATVQSKMPHTDADGFAESIIALAMLDFRPPQGDGGSRLAAWGLRARECASEVKQGLIPRLIWALQKLRLPRQDGAWGALASRAELLLPHLQPKALAKIASALPALRGHATPNFFIAMDAAVATSAGKFPVRDLAKVSVGYARVGRGLPPGVTRPPPQKPIKSGGGNGNAVQIVGASKGSGGNAVTMQTVGASKSSGGDGDATSDALHSAVADESSAWDGDAMPEELQFAVGGHA